MSVSHMLKGAIAGALALGCLAVVPNEASAMPVSNIAAAAETGAGVGAGVEKAYWRGWGWRRPWGWGWRHPYYGWGRPYGWGAPYGWGWRRPFYGHPYRRFYRW